MSNANIPNAMWAQKNDVAPPPTAPYPRSLATSSRTSTNTRTTASTLPSQTRAPDSSTHKTTNHQSQSYKRLPYTADEDEKRLIADYSTPADAVHAPLPSEWVDSFSMVKPKPGANSSYKPVNTIDKVNTYPTRTPVTYGKKHGISPGKGGRMFLEAHGLSTSGTPDVRPESHSSPPLKRRRTNQHEIIDLDTEEEAESRPPYSQHDQSSPKHAPSVTSRSQRSRDSVSFSGAGLKRSKLPVSSFANTEQMAASHRKKSRNAKGDVKARLRSHDVSNYTEDLYPQKTSDLDELGENDGFTSHHFSTTSRASKPLTLAQINHSTSPRNAADAGDSRGSEISPKNLRDTFRRAGRDSVEDESDELQETHASSARAVVSRERSSTKVRPPAKSTPKRNILNTKSNAWPLNYARTHFFNPDGTPLGLKLCQEGGVFEIIYLDSGKTVIDERIEIKRINEAEFDNDSRIRLKGSRVGSTTYVVDLEFVVQADCKTFCETYVKRHTRNNKIFLRTCDHMNTLFSKGLEVNDKISSSLEVVLDRETELIEKRQRNHEYQVEPRRAGKSLLENLISDDDFTSKQKPRASSNFVSTAREEDANSVSQPTRLSRATRKRPEATETEEEPFLVRDEERFSVKHGLGKPWEKPIQYNSDRQRAQRATVHFTDLERLDEGQFLNDALIDFYLMHVSEPRERWHMFANECRYCFERSNIPPDKVYLFNTHFYTTLTRPVSGPKSINYAGVARWTAKVDIFTYDYIVVPINENAHWYLAIICNAPSIPRLRIVNGLSASSPVPTQPARESVFDVTTGPKTVNEEEAQELLKTKSRDNAVIDLDEDNLDDAKIKLVDAHAVDEHDDPLTHSGENKAVRESPVAETARLGTLSLNDQLEKEVLEAPASSTAAKAKSKRKHGSALRKLELDVPRIVILDSLEGTHPKAVRALKDYIIEEGEQKRAMHAEIKQPTFYARARDIPTQQNFTDCGVFLLAYAEKFFADPREFTDLLFSREMKSDLYWPDLDTSKMRDQIRNILYDLYNQQLADRSAERKLAKASKKAKALPLALYTDTVNNPPRLQSPFQEKPKIEASNRSRTPNSSKPAEPIVSSPKSTRRTSPKVVIRSSVPKSPLKRPPSPVHGCYNMYSNAASAALNPPDLQESMYTTTESSKRQKHSRAPTFPIQHMSPERPKITQRIPRMSPAAKKIFSARDEHQPCPADVKSPSRGSSLAPITIDDSQDALVVTRHQPPFIELDRRSSPHMPRKKHRPTLSFEMSTENGAEGKDMLFSSNSIYDRSRLFAVDDSMTTPERSPPGAHHNPRQGKAAQVILDDDDDELEVPESPLESRSSPTQDYIQSVS
ncbi:cysteine proteinase [Pleomassaria siparia CBS 279.74]|uniref:Cysteine proteinase n=1 Tax=Pleomassaria siparia CBS 279.74 TaxID=1314801 RepID=A0A6G1JRE9_9PLEO|nr:cysteine proteinase [Pleomassaria siparia CBS 279.74]